MVINKVMTTRKSVSFHGFSVNMVSGYTGPEFVTKEKVLTGPAFVAAGFFAPAGPPICNNPQPTTHDPPSSFVPCPLSGNGYRGRCR
jgi:hypothetical protein